MKTIYLDYAAATPVNPRVLAAMKPYFADKFYNPSAIYLASRQVRKELEQARATVANCLGAKPAEIIFTAGATEANNLAIQGIMRQFPYGEVLVSAIEHESVIKPAGLFNCKKIDVNSGGQIILDSSDVYGASTLSEYITDKTVLVSIGYVNNEIGTVQPLREITAIIGEERKRRRAKGNKTPLYFHTDAAQAPNYFDLHVSRLGVDLMSINGGKMYGPKQSGALYVKDKVRLIPLILGGGQEFNLRSGTENVPSAIGLAAALKLAQEHRQTEVKQIGKLRSLFINGLEKAVPKFIVNGSKKRATPHIISVTFPGYDNERLMMQLDEIGIQVAIGSACAASGKELSHVLSAIGLSDEMARSTLRVSLGKQTTISDIHKAVEVLSKFTQRLA